ncbi:ABC-F family ATP-binding cassette domain-containing protein [Pelosinus baikalensis]|uniref:ABC-F family ATP-binding cassette domain-containing protein n=1 Tax=Pelosinus baikalensis TaxID=2892015 RepID=A0ABS8HKP8_9FIRM|nr:ABC-F family ATP-binding cassette domain-containing protein [Pelosinus baikalensis]MCC5463753.1 ABC-F family ATP-binding cassette domain-containing protein [Pelosinus baikalensis]
MNIVSIEKLSKSYGTKNLFSNVSFGIDENDKIGLIGVNGTGKSTFLKVIAGLEEADDGKVMIGNTIEVQYLAQNPSFNPSDTVLDQVFQGYSPIMKLLREYEQVLLAAEDNPKDQGLQKQLIALSQQMDGMNGWQLESEAKIILTQLGITDFTAKVGTLSGGQRKRIALASALIHPADLLILDEPTNHIDNDTVAWLEEYLHKRKGALLMITHDRYFLDRVVNRIIELDKGNLYSYTGNYSLFLELKMQREADQEASENKRQNLLRNELAWMRRGAKARTTKQKARIERFEKLSDEKVDLSQDRVEITAGASRLGRKIIEIANVCKSFGERAVIQNFSYIVLRNDRMGIVGPNGSGKSTLLNLVTQKLNPDSGVIEIGQTVKIGYFSQENTDMDEDLRVIEYIKEEANFISSADGGIITASQMLERFLFSPEMQWTPIRKLSGGEKRRLYLLRILMGSPNVLLLDEPTNDLDIQTLTILEDYLDDFPGAVIAVSHDRYFLDRVVEKVFAFEKDGSIRQYVGGYSDYQSALAYNEEKQNQGKETSSEQTQSERPKERSRKFTFKEQKEYEEIDDVIASVEKEIQIVSNRINTSGSNFTLLQELTEIQQQLEKKLEELLERWTYLNELAEEIGHQ